MNVDLLGAKCLPSAGPMVHAVVPLNALPSASAHSKAAPPQSCTSIPRCFLYHAHSAFGSLALMKMPPMPVTLRMRTSDGGVSSRGLAQDCHQIRSEVHPMWEREVLRRDTSY